MRNGFNYDSNITANESKEQAEQIFKERSNNHAQESNAGYTPSGGIQVTMNSNGRDSLPNEEFSPFDMDMGSHMESGKNYSSNNHGYTSSSDNKERVFATAGRELPEGTDHILMTGHKRDGSPISGKLEPHHLVNVGDLEMEVRTAVQLGYLYQDETGFRQVEHPDIEAAFQRKWSKEKAEREKLDGKEILGLMPDSMDQESKELFYAATNPATRDAAIERATELVEAKEKARQKEVEQKIKENSPLSKATEAASELINRAGSTKTFKNYAQELIDTNFKLDSDRAKYYAEKFQLNPEELTRATGNIMGMIGAETMVEYDTNYSKKDGVSAQKLFQEFMRQAPQHCIQHAQALMLQDHHEAIDYVRRSMLPKYQNR